MDPKYFLILGVAFMMGWYAFGTWYNVRRGDALARWMQSGLPRIGEKTTFRWLGSSVLELGIKNPREGMTRAVILIVLKPRDLPWNWIFSRLRGRGDTLIFRFDLSRSPRLPFELADPHAWTGKMSIDDAAHLEWERRDHENGVLLAPAGHLDRAAAAFGELSPLLTPFPPFIRLGLRREPPHLELHLPFPDPRRDSAEILFDAILRLVRKVGSGQAGPAGGQPADR